MLPAQFRFIWPSGFRGEFCFKSANQKQELPVAAMFVNGLGQNDHSIYGRSSIEIAHFAVFEFRLLNLLARKLQNWNIYIDSIDKIWQKSLVRINFHWPWATRPLLKSMTDFILIHSQYNYIFTLLKINEIVICFNIPHFNCCYFFLK
jgi:hypothetical protein